MASTGLAGVRYIIDTRVSQFTVQAFASGLVAVVAHSPKIAIRDWSGDVHMTANSLQPVGLRVLIKSASLEVLDELGDSDRREIHRVMNQEVLETARYPEILYESSEITTERLREDLYRLRIGGKLTLHGVSDDQPLVSQVSLGADSARAYGEFSVRQSDYNIRIASIAGGSLKLQDDLKLSFYVVARRQE